jgi:hypothetical protein
MVVELCLIAVPYGAVVASFAMWWGGWSAPARFLVPLMPLAILPLASAWRDGGGAIRSVFVSLSAIGVANLLVRTLAADGHLLYNLRDGYDLLLDWLSRTVNLPLAMPAVHRSTIADAMLISVIWLGTAIIAVLVLRMIDRWRSPRAAGRWTITGVVGILAVTMATTASWRASNAAPLTPQTSKLNLLQRWQPSFGALTVEPLRLRRMSAGAALDRFQFHGSERVRDAAGDRSSLLALSRVPAGQYHVVIQATGPLTGHLTVSVGVTEQPLESWTLAETAGGDFTISLPTMVHSLVIRGDDIARMHIRDLWLKPARLVTGSRAQGLARRASRYGPVLGFFFDDGIYVEPEGVWTGGDIVAALVLLTDNEDASVDVALRAGPVPARLVATAGGWSTQVSLAAGEHRLVTFPTKVRISVATHGGFRPVDYEPGATDRRLLGIRIEFPSRSSS